jgi:serine/threonine-protein kinase PknG
VGDQYEVVGCLDHGGLGWVYLAKDKHLDDNLVALKGLINTNDLDALEMAVNERRFLTRLDHPNIVGIVNFVGHLDPYSGGQTGYIVMEYVGGLSLREIKETARKGGRPFGEPLRAEHVLAYGIEILAAFEYLHDQGLLYCDMKPDNAIHIRNQIKLIDLAAVRRIGDRTSPVIGTRGYQPPDEEIRTLGPSVESDIHALGRTLGELFEATTDFSVRGRSNGGGGRSHGDGGARLVVESCRRVVKRAAHPDPGRRFRSAAHMGAELREVQREILSLRDGQERPGGSARFAPPTVLLDAGLGQVPSLGRWTTPGGEEATRDGDALQRLPAAPRGAARLQAPLPDPDDPGADLLDDVDGGSRARSLDDLLNFRGSAGIALRLCREYLEPAGDSATTDHLDKAKAFLESAASLLPAGSSDWRVVWHRGLLALARCQIDTALTWFDRIYDEMPGEEAPKLAIGFCKEHQGALDEAEGYYEAVWRRNRSQVNAAFALARIWLHRARRKEAVEVLEEVPQTSRHYDAARIAMVRIHLGRLAVAEGDGRPTAADFDQVLRRLADLDLDGGTGEGESSDRLVALVRETALGRLAEVEHGDGREILGDPVTERTLRTLLEQSYRRLARQARGPKEYELLIDRANDIRPWTLL